MKLVVGEVKFNGLVVDVFEYRFWLYVVCFIFKGVLVDIVEVDFFFVFVNFEIDFVGEVCWEVLLGKIDVVFFRF